jgi:serine/threonine protein kinase
MENYVLDKSLLGSGSFGISYKAKRKSDNIDVCLKYSHKIQDNDQRMEFEKEIHALSVMKHKNIINYISHFYHEDRICIEMELADGGSFPIHKTRFNRARYFTDFYSNCGRNSIYSST